MNRPRRQPSDRQRTVSDRQRVLLRRRLRGFGIAIALGLLALVAVVSWRLSPPPALEHAPPSTAAPAQPDPVDDSAEPAADDDPAQLSPEDWQRLPTWMRPSEAIELSAPAPNGTSARDGAAATHATAAAPPPLRALRLLRHRSKQTVATLEDGGRYPASLAGDDDFNIVIEIASAPGLHIHFVLDQHQQLERNPSFAVFGDKIESGDQLLPGPHELLVVAGIGEENRTADPERCPCLQGPQHRIRFEILAE